MTEPSNRSNTLYRGVLLQICGIAAVIFSTLRIIRFTSQFHSRPEPGIIEWFLGLILPHIGLLTGIGMLAGGIILSVKYYIIRKRLQNNEV